MTNWNKNVERLKAPFRQFSICELWLNYHCLNSAKLPFDRLEGMRRGFLRTVCARLLQSLRCPTKNWNKTNTRRPRRPHRRHGGESKADRLIKLAQQKASFHCFQLLKLFYKKTYIVSCVILIAIVLATIVQRTQSTSIQPVLKLFKAKLSLVHIFFPFTQLNRALLLLILIEK